MIYSRYFLVVNNDKCFPCRDMMIEHAWGKVPVSFVQDSEDLDSASYIDVKVNKWEVNGKWSNMQFQEPWVRIEIYRRDAIKLFLSANDVAIPIDKDREFIVVFELDEGWLDVDLLILSRLVKTFIGGEGCKIYVNNLEFVNREIFLNSVPSKEMIKKMITLADADFGSCD